MDARRWILALTALALASSAHAVGGAPAQAKQRGVPSTGQFVPGAVAIPSATGFAPGAVGVSVPAVQIVAGAPGMGLVAPELLRPDHPLPSRVEAVSAFNPAKAEAATSVGINEELGKNLNSVGNDAAEANKSLADGDVGGARDGAQRKFDNGVKAPAASISVADAQNEFAARVAAFGNSGKIAGYSGKDADLGADIERVREHIKRMSPSDPDYKAANALLRDLIAKRASATR